MIELVRPGTNIDFIGKRRLCAALSVLVLAAGLAAIPLQGIRLGIDFAGGSEVQVRFAPGVPANEGRIRDIVSRIEGMQDASVIRFGEEDANEYLIKFAGDIEQSGAVADAAPALVGEDAEAEPAPPEAAAEAAAPAASLPAGDRVTLLKDLLAEGIGPLSVERVEFVGPRVGQELQRDGLMALGLACVFILVYIAFRFSARFAPGAIVALVHDVLVTAGLFVVLGLEFDLRILAAMLAIIGYSLNDTIIIYDRVRENLELHTKRDLPEVLNLSVNQTLSRTILTSGTTLAVVLCLLVLGGEVIWPFAFAMTIGVVVGTYSSVYIAAPILLLLESRFGGAGGGASAAGGRGDGHPASKGAGKGKPKKGAGKSGRGRAAARARTS